MSRPIADPDMEAYAEAHSTPPSDMLQRVAAATRESSPMPDMMVDALEGRFLAFLVALSGASRILEVGTFTGYSAIAMAEALPDDGRITSLELSAEHAQMAREHIEAAGLADRITVIEGPALDSLRSLAGPYDLVFIDADKSAYPEYYELTVPMLAERGLIVADNVLREGRVLDAETTHPDIIGLRAFNDRAAADPRVECVMLTIRDGVTLIRRR